MVFHLELSWASWLEYLQSYMFLFNVFTVLFVRWLVVINLHQDRQ